MKKVSIIIPVFNSEKHLRQCIDSVLNQTYKNIELILVDDGSTDSSKKIEKEFEEKDSRVKIITQINEGSGPARNNGLKKASGEYVMFVDSDDWIEKDMVSVLIGELEKNSVDFLTTSGNTDYYDDNGKLIKSDVEKFNNEVIKDVDTLHKRYVSLFLNNCLGGPHKKIYKMDIIRDNNIVFPDLRRSQDIVFNYRYFEYIKSLMVLDSNFYHYRIEVNNYNKKIHNEYYKAVCLIYNDINDLLNKWNVKISKDEELDLNQYFYNLIVWQICIGESSDVMKDIVNNDTVQKIFRKSTPKGIKQKTLNILVKKKKYKTINSLIKTLKKMK